MRLTISLGQMDVVFGCPEENLEKMREMAAQAASRRSQVLVLPELWTTGYNLERAARFATSTDQGIFVRVAQVAREHRLYIVGSSLSNQEGKFFNTATIFSPAGELLARYDKLHLFPPMDEPEYLAPGREGPVFDLPWGRCALAICYDLRFPELFLHYALAGAEVIFVPAEWPHPRLLHWQVLLRARAIEDQCFIIGCNRVGESKGFSFFGHSAIYGPKGELVIEGGEQEMLLTAEMDLAEVAATRRELPVLEARRDVAIGDKVKEA